MTKLKKSCGWVLALAFNGAWAQSADIEYADVDSSEAGAQSAAPEEFDIEDHQLAYDPPKPYRPMSSNPTPSPFVNPGLAAGSVKAAELEQEVVKIINLVRARIRSATAPAVWNRIVGACRYVQTHHSGGHISKSDQKAAIAAIQRSMGPSFTEELIQRGIYRPDDFGGYSPLDLFAYVATAYNEAREQKGGSWQSASNPYVRAEMVATMKVMQNRTRATNLTPTRTLFQVVMEPGQFSGWTSGSSRSDPNFSCMMAGPSSDLSQRRATRAVVDLLDPRTRYWPNAHKTRYFHARGGWPPGTPVRNPTVTLAGHAPIRLVLHNFGNIK